MGYEPTVKAYPRLIAGGIKPELDIVISEIGDAANFYQKIIIPIFHVALFKLNLIATGITSPPPGSRASQRAKSLIIDPDLSLWRFKFLMFAALRCCRSIGIPV